MKGAVMVRKLVMWQTNKETDGDDYPAYVIHYTDYSPNRKTPLEREIRVSSSPEQIKNLWDELAAEGFTKGWVPVGESPAAKDVAAAAPPSKAAEEAVPLAASDEPPPPAKKRAGTKKKAD
jgi:hypothetical protein